MIGNFMYDERRGLTGRYGNINQNTDPPGEVSRFHPLCLVRSCHKSDGYWEKIWYPDVPGWYPEIVGLWISLNSPSHMVTTTVLTHPYIPMKYAENYQRTISVDSKHP